MAEGARLESVYTATYRGFESPPHRHISEKSRYLCIGSFLLCSPIGGMRIPDRGSTTGTARWTEWPQAMTPAGRAKRVNPPSPPYFRKEPVLMYRLFSFMFPNRGDENPRPGSTTGTARWTEWPQAMTPAGRAKRVNPPLTAIFENERVRKYGLFFA